MTGEINLGRLLKTMQPQLNNGEFVFCTIENLASISSNDIIMTFKEREGTTVIVTRETADNFNWSYSFIASWITLTVHSSLEAVGLTAAFSNALANQGISCNVVAAFYHDHIFVDKKDTAKAMDVLQQFSKNV
jgi:hypothetical protein